MEKLGYSSKETKDAQETGSPPAESSFADTMPTPSPEVQSIPDSVPPPLSKHKADNTVETPPVVSKESPEPQPTHTLPVSSGEYAKRAKELIQLNRKIRSLGGVFEFDLPRIAVIGSQSSGKSSLVEAISGRSPRERNMHEMTSNEELSWSSTVFLVRTEYDILGAARSTTRKQFGPIITDKGSLELWIRRAQAAILSPHRHETDFYDKSAEVIRHVLKEDLQVLSFSKDIVEVEVRDPELVPLTFVDLPGLIQFHEKAETIPLVQSLIKSFIGGDKRCNTLILIVIPMSDDINNQEAMKFAKEFDTQGLRTIGILTKPDLITSGATGSQVEWRSTLEGRGKYPLKHGYYCVRLPDDAEREKRLTKMESQKLARDFFASTAPWNELGNHNLFGVPNLVSSVSDRLVELIESNLPRLRKEADVWATGIEFKPYLQDQPHSDADVIKDLESKEPFDNATTPEWERVDTPVFTQQMDLRDVRKVIHEATAWELPGHVPFRATEVLVERSTSKWLHPTVACFNQIFDNSWVVLEKLVPTYFGKYDVLQNFIRDLTRAEFEACKKDTLDALKSAVGDQQHPLYTQNYEYFSSERTKWRNRFIAASSGGYVPFDDDVRAEYQEELKLMGDVRAYLNVAFKRFIDNIPLLIENRLNRDLARNLPARLIGSIKVDNPEELVDLMAEKVVVREKRRTLKEYVSRLLEIQALVGDVEDLDDSRSVESCGPARFPKRGGKKGGKKGRN
ncbi:hypothetical protein Moror_4132 [Moniliophthora roreri MCA 2997]|uniref:P-loop containing nucleoside triphosphate hydrolase protein n=1 Tax=Moniliophthora roreri (strain MCA 2997) TaxID=1381753 RepID=V2WV11_MONRO|nr:hypothetical protein Moror_4132 [Moniliophthora roreri MCA 2997]